MADVILAPDHSGMKVDYRGMLKEARRVLRRDFGATSAFMLEVLEKNLTEMGERFYAGDAAAVDEFLQLYCIARDRRPTSPTLPHPALDRANAGERESEIVAYQYRDMSWDGFTEWSLPLRNMDGIEELRKRPGREFRYLVALPAADPERREGTEGVGASQPAQEPQATLRIELEYDDDDGPCEIICRGTERHMRMLDARLKFLHKLERESNAGAPIPHTFAPPDADTDDSMEGGKRHA